jgi:hypothetical protein
MLETCFVIVIFALLSGLAMEQVDSPHIALRRSCLVFGLTMV